MNEYRDPGRREFSKTYYHESSRVTADCIKCAVEGDRGAAGGGDVVMVQTSPRGNTLQHVNATRRSR